MLCSPRNYPFNVGKSCMFSSCSYPAYSCCSAFLLMFVPKNRVSDKAQFIVGDMSHYLLKRLAVAQKNPISRNSLMFFPYFSQFNLNLWTLEKISTVNTRISHKAPVNRNKSAVNQYKSYKPAINLY
jgi:hypothetical protein